MSTIWKIAMTPRGHGGGQVFDVPQGAVFRHCAAQHDQIALWLEIPDTTAAIESRWFRMFHTGSYLPAEPMTYLGTALLDGGAYVVHVYEAPHD
jgi:hypothetical protein